MLAWPRELPIAGQPADVVATVARYQEALQRSPLPKLLFTAEPGILVRSELVAWCRTNLPNLEVVPLGPGVHYLQARRGRTALAARASPSHRPAHSPEFMAMEDVWKTTRKLTTQPSTSAAKLTETFHVFQRRPER